MSGSWQHTTLGELGRYINGRGFKSSEWGLVGRPIIRIQNLTGTNNNFNYFDGVVDERNVVRSGDLLVSWAATLGAYFWHGTEALVNQHIFKVESDIDLKFHKYLLDFRLADLVREAHGSGMVHVTRKVFEQMPVSVPADQAEQRRIVAVLENHLSRQDVGKQTWTAAQRRIVSAREQVIRDALLGRHVSGLRGAPELPGAGVDDGLLPGLPPGWSWRRLQDVADVVGGVTKDAKKQSDVTVPEVPYLRVANVQRTHLRLDKVTTIRVPRSKADQLRLQRGDVLLNEGGDRDKLARGWVWEEQIPGCIHQNHVFRARVRDQVVDPYFLAWTANVFGGPWAERNGKQSVNLASISLSKIKLMPVVVPPRLAGAAAVEQISSRLADLDRLSQAVAMVDRRAAQLRRSLLAAAFSGRL